MLPVASESRADAYFTRAATASKIAGLACCKPLAHSTAYGRESRVCYDRTPAEPAAPIICPYGAAWTQQGDARRQQQPVPSIDRR